MDIADLFTGSVLHLWRKPLVSLFQVMIWMFVFLSITVSLSGIFDVKAAVALASFNIFFLIVAYYVNVYLIERLLEKKRYGLYLVSFTLILGAVVLIRVYFNRYYLEEILNGVFPVKENWIYLFSIVTTLVVMMISLFNGLLVNRSQKEKEYQATIARHREAQVEFLKAQMSPHFLFNTLNNIYSLTMEKASLASEMILVLSEILRYAVYETRKDKVSLSDEIVQIKKLIHLYQLKSEHSLPVSITVDVSSTPFFIEPMILIPLVENCFKHGNLETSPDAYIAVLLLEENGNLTFETANSREELPKVKLDAGGIALINIKERLSIRYPNRHRIEIKESPDSFFVRLQILKANE